MSASVRAAILTLAVVATVAACQRREDKTTTPPAPAPETTAAAAAPMSFATETPFARVELKLPDALKNQPDLHALLYAQEVRQLRQYVEGAQGIRTEAGDDPDQPPYEKIITFDAAAETEGLLSLQRTDFDYSGGAHPNTVNTGLLWDKAAKRQITPAQFFAAGANFAALDRVLCVAANAAKRARDPSAQPVTAGGATWACPRAADTAFVLTPGTAPGKAGGLTFLVGPYVIGPYSDGPYELVVPQEQLRGLIAPAYVAQFEGRPVANRAGS